MTSQLNFGTRQMSGCPLRKGQSPSSGQLTINALRAKKKVIAIGIAFAAQEIDKVPATARDARLDLVLTEREVIDFRRA